MSEINHWYLHVDLDAFFASVEQLDHPEYRGKPLIVGGKPEDRRSVVSTASYEARKFGVHSAMPTYQAYKLCPQGIFVYGRMQRYAEISHQVMSIFKEYSPDVDQMSIDEAFIDLTGTEKLFGPPEETAMKIKAHVKRDTGLNVSVGLATTKYLAKIASDYDKPDGFFHIKKGDEENFMLNLPLKKVWGIGPKSLKDLNNKGFFTTRDIYEKSYDMLEFLFGKNMAGFLYNVVRGQEMESFGKKAKTHSISAETTFPFDLTDLYSIETALLELAHGVFFRLLKENSYSKTAFVKIRYDDFSTCSIQETVNRNIITLDSYYEILKRLFEKKYEPGRGIRLLGVGLENLEKEPGSYQPDLFENKDEKKQAVEKAILNLEKKHPEIKIRKARTLNKTRALILFVLAGLFTPKLQAENTVSQKGASTVSPDTFYVPSQLQQEAPESLFEWNIDDKNNVEFALEGYWKSEFTGSLTSSFGNNKPFAISNGIPVYKQEVEISAWVFLNKHWYTKAEFAEQFTKNTIEMGYVSDDFIRSVKIANRGISIDNNYSADTFGFGLKSGMNQAPGISSHLQTTDDRFEADLLFRYDMTSTRSATYYGMNQVQDIKIAPGDFLYGYAFNFPENTQNYLIQIKDVYVENSRGAFTSSNGKHFKKLSNTDYFYRQSENRLYLSSGAGAGKQDNSIPTVIVTFTDITAVSSILTETGDYSSPETFAGNIQQQFNQADNVVYNLADYTPPLQSIIEGLPALVIQCSNGFSPFVAQNIYDCGLVQNADISIVSNTSNKTLKNYSAQLSSSELNQFYEDFFLEKHSYTVISNKELTKNYYPFVQTNPEIYLNLNSNTDKRILIRSYSPVSEFQIGTNASAGTVIVYINNVIDTSAVYNPNTGIVTLTQTPNNTDRIQIFWQEESASYNNGMITGGAGFKYHFTPELTADFSITSKWPVSINDSYADSSNIQKGFVAAATGIDYHTDNLRISNKTAGAVQKENGNSSLLVYAPSDNVPVTYYLEETSGFSTKTTPVLNVDNKTISLNSTANCTISDFSGQSDDSLLGSKIPLRWNFTDKNSWAAVDVHLGAGNLLCNSYALRLLLKPEIPLSETDNYELYLQLGVKASEDFEGEENTFIPTWKITDLDFSKENWQVVSVPLSSNDRSKLVSSNDARLIIKAKDSYAAGRASGSLYFGAYEPVVKSIDTYQDENILVQSTGINTGKNDYTTVINWTVPVTTELQEIKDTVIRSESYFSATDFSSYKNINLEFAVSGNQAVDYTSSTSKPGFSYILQNDDSVALKLEINDISSLFSSGSSNLKLTINTDDNLVYLDDNQLDSSTYNLYINKNVVPTKQSINVNTVQNQKLYQNGTIYINKLLYSDSKLYYTVQNQMDFEYQHKDTILKINNYDLVKNFKISAASRQAASSIDKDTYSFNSNANSSITVAEIKLQADGTVANTELTNAGHLIKTEKNILNLFSFQDEYRFNSRDTELNKTDIAAINTEAYKIPLALSAKTSAREQSNLRNQDGEIAFKLNPVFGNFGINFDNRFAFGQKINKNDYLLPSFDTEHYFNGYQDISQFQLSKGEEQAFLRTTHYEAKLEEVFPFNSFKPSLTYKLDGEYKTSDNIDFTDTTTAILSLPFTISKNSLAFNLTRTGGCINPSVYGGDYSSDFQKVLELQKDRNWFYEEIPFYDLFDDDLTSKVKGNYSAQYDFNYKRPLFNNFKDIYIPSSLTMAVSRTIKTDNNLSDLYQFKSVITNTSVNNLGSNSSKQLFKWFRQEEIVSSLTGIVKLPKDLPENLTYQITAYVQILFIIYDKATLTTALDYTLESNQNWTTHETLIYARPGKTSFITDFVNLFTPKTKQLNFEITRKDSLNMEFGSFNSQFKNKTNYQHSVDFNYLKYFTLSTGLGGTFTYLEKQASTLVLEYTISGKMEF